jgi:hypothetical protein
VCFFSQAYKVRKDFIFYRMRHEVPATFKAAIKAQNQFLNQACIVPIKGIPWDMMWAMESKLLALTGVKEVLPHWKASSEGRWNLLTHAKAFAGVIRYLGSNLELLYDTYLTQCQKIPQAKEYPQAKVCTKHPYSDGDSKSDKSYFLNCSNLYSTLNDDVSVSDPPYWPSVQAWGKPAPQQIHVSDVTTVASTKTSDISNPLVGTELKRLCAENIILQESIIELKTQFAAMQQLAKATIDPPPPILEAPTPPLTITSDHLNARLNSFEDQLQRLFDHKSWPEDLTTPPRIANMKRQNMSGTPPTFKGASTEVTLL